MEKRKSLTRTSEEAVSGGFRVSLRNSYGVGSESPEVLFYDYRWSLFWQDGGLKYHYSFLWHLVPLFSHSPSFPVSFSLTHRVVGFVVGWVVRDVNSWFMLSLILLLLSTRRRDPSHMSSTPPPPELEYVILLYFLKRFTSSVGNLFHNSPVTLSLVEGKNRSLLRSRCVVLCPQF